MDLATANDCAVASLAPSGTATVTLPGAVGTSVAAIITLVAQAPKTNVKVACTIPGGYTVNAVSSFCALFI